MDAEGIKEALPSGKRGLLVAVVLLVALLGAGYLTGVFGAPGVSGVDNEFGNVTDETTEVRTALIVENPNPFGIRPGETDVNYTVEMNGVRMASGEKEGLALSRGTSTLTFSTQMRNERIPRWWVTHVRNDERTTLSIRSNVHSSWIDRSVGVPYQQEIETDVISEFNSTETRPVNASVPLVSDPVLYVNETSANWGQVTESETPIRTRMTVYNPKSIPYTISEIGYRVTMNDVAVGNGTTKNPYVVPANSKKTLRMQTVIDNAKLDEWWVSHLENEQVSDLKITFYAKIELPGGDTVRVPLKDLTYEKRIKTHIFGNDSAEGKLSRRGGTNDTNADTSTPSGTTAGDGPADGGTTTTDDGGILGDVTWTVQPPSKVLLPSSHV